MSSANPPAGFEPFADPSPFLDRIGPIWQRREGPILTLGVRIEEQQCNRRGIAHGGLYAAIADICMGKTMSWSREPIVPLVTSTLALEYVDSAKLGDWLEARCDFTQVGGRVAYANCYLTVGDKVVVRASSAFLVLERK
jgi:acyl-coenzyme A thioesterase 13